MVVDDLLHNLTAYFRLEIQHSLVEYVIVCRSRLIADHTFDILHN